ncbi:hypothetical protein [Gordonia rhizosphera]|uniref:hypothetical protein n=1 Tax=Gordonia rhizosphera TaxID=83341 RepID=UPI0012F6C757|nr:hypothetical protein [Gordonia rhizosphera]
MIAAASPASAAVTAVQVSPGVGGVYGTGCDITVTAYVDTRDPVTFALQYPNGGGVGKVNVPPSAGKATTTFRTMPGEVGLNTITATQSTSEKSTSIVVVPGVPCTLNSGSSFGS